jgi:hypothetical protein
LEKADHRATIGEGTRESAPVNCLIWTGKTTSGPRKILFGMVSCPQPQSRPALKKLLPKKVKDLIGFSALLVRIDIEIINTRTNEVIKYISDYAPLFQWSAGTPGLLPADRVEFKGAGSSSIFEMPAFVGDEFLCEKSFSGKIGLQLQNVTGSGMCINITFYDMPGRNMVSGYKLIDLNGLPDLPSVSKSATGTGGANLTHV